ncbi:MAG: hypothetical protein HFI89_04130 [Lachnospiraceae bacterium]|nr:hypothetical protein [Lachnospiraceae bacterium]
MRKIRLAGLTAVLCLAVFLLGGCSKSDNFEPLQDCLYIRENGTVEEALFDTLDKEYFSSDGLKSFIEEAVIRYNSDAAGIARAYAEDDDDNLPVSIRKLETDKNNKAILILDYATPKHYIDFNGEAGLAKQLTTGSVESALSVGVNLDVGLKAAKDGSAVTPDTIKKHGKYRVILIQGVTPVQVQGKVMYISDNVTVIDNNVVSVNAEDEVAYIIFK